MAKKTGFFEDAPVFKLAMTALLVTFVAAALSAFYNNYSPAFNNHFAYQALNRAATVADANFVDAGMNAAYKKEISGILYTYLLAVVYKIAGANLSVIIVYLFSLTAFFFTLLMFYRLSHDMLGEEYAFLATLVFALSAPVVLAATGGADVWLTMMLFALNAYFLYFCVENNKFTGAFITSGLMLLNGYFGLVFGVLSAVYVLLRMNNRALKKYAAEAMTWTAAGLGLLCSALFIYVFMENFTPEAFDSSALFRNTTFYVDSFFKDGFLWSKLFPPFFTLFFYFSLFVYLSRELKERRLGMGFYFGLTALISLLAEFFVMFAPASNTVYFLTPFYFVLVLLACKGIIQLSELIGKGKDGALSPKTLIVAVLLFTALYNGVAAFNMSTDRNREIRSILNEGYAVKFSGRQ